MIFPTKFFIWFCYDYCFIVNILVYTNYLPISVLFAVVIITVCNGVLNIRGIFSYFSIEIEIKGMSLMLEKYHIKVVYVQEIGSLFCAVSCEKIYNGLFLDLQMLVLQYNTFEWASMFKIVVKVKTIVFI